MVLSAAGRGFSLRGRRGHQDLEVGPATKTTRSHSQNCRYAPTSLGAANLQSGRRRRLRDPVAAPDRRRRDTTIVEHAEIPIHRPGGLVDTTPARPSLRHLRQNHHRLTDTGPWVRTARLRTRLGDRGSRLDNGAVSSDVYRDDDRGYARWLSLWPGGYVLNIAATLNPAGRQSAHGQLLEHSAAGR